MTFLFNDPHSRRRVICSTNIGFQITHCPSYKYYLNLCFNLPKTPTTYYLIVQYSCPLFSGQQCSHNSYPCLHTWPQSQQFIQLTISLLWISFYSYYFRWYFMQEDQRAFYLPVKSQETKEQEMKQFIDRYELKNLTYREMYEIYSKHALDTPFRTTMYSALALVLLPGLTNIYYMLKPNAMMARIAPFAMPIICITQYIAAFKYDIQNYCFTDSDDSAVLRKKYMVLKKVQLKTSELDKFEEEIRMFQKLKNQKGKAVV